MCQWVEQMTCVHQHLQTCPSLLLPAPFPLPLFPQEANNCGWLHSVPLAQMREAAFQLWELCSKCVKHTGTSLVGVKG